MVVPYICFVSLVLINLDYFLFKKNSAINSNFPKILNIISWLFCIFSIIIIWLGEAYSDSSSGGFNENTVRNWNLIILELIIIICFCLFSIITFFYYLKNSKNFTKNEK